MTSKILGNKGITPIDGVKRTRKVEVPKDDGQQTAKDRVAFSSVLQEVNKAKEPTAGSDAERADKVAALKEQIGNGTYKPDLEKVAESVLKFLSEQESS
ncbi:MAG: flagellar biosynthesis anti-sigma factor FlgM [Desulfuromonas sp.]|uniref:flagellar biosynthesis anti-sigma factor FlgM n=1 Tax=Desulfuromonas sp. TaxID=892 RepID=UPI000CBBEC37|nr:flagellar biosynthesis anti-sigma factor FlgM [Desulfuromonas sp.]PLX84471.1 MAG: flagellar biosynthesis anti-sigma factor FlgM [Desulfuromonas sp.]